jgi:sulfite dehydrogenase (cytochrome) subunit B
MMRRGPRVARLGATFALVALTGAADPAVADGDESGLRLVSAPGSEIVAARCVVCHSVDYIVMNAPIQGRTGWEATVNKMIKVMQAPITPDEAARIVAYLDTHYGAPPARRP